MAEREVLCPYCKVPMAYIQEVERIGNEKRIVRYYRCPVCGAKIMDEVMRIVRINGSIKLLISGGQGRVVVPSQRRPAKRVRVQARRK